MSDCANGCMAPYPALKLRVEFDEGPAWEYPIALNGREVARVLVDGVEHAPARECDVVRKVVDTPNGRRVLFLCSECESWLGKAAGYCPNCGARVRKD